jgi:hypothetical protein
MKKLTNLNPRQMLAQLLYNADIQHQKLKVILSLVMIHCVGEFDLEFEILFEPRKATNAGFED